MACKFSLHSDYMYKVSMQSATRLIFYELTFALFKWLLQCFKDNTNHTVPNIHLKVNNETGEFVNYMENNSYMKQALV